MELSIREKGASTICTTRGCYCTAYPERRFLTIEAGEFIWDVYLFTYLYIYDTVNLSKNINICFMSVDGNTSFPVLCMLWNPSKSHFITFYPKSLWHHVPTTSKSVTWSNVKLINSPLYRSSRVTGNKVGKLLLTSQLDFFLRFV